MRKRLRVIYSGTVQGVGFRATVARLAQDLSVEGAVWNRRDGRVELLVEGEECAIHQLLDRVEAAHLAPWIQSIDSAWEEPTGKLRGFVIAREEEFPSGDGFSLFR
ncbi:acylphosphatase [Verrucomicrobium sp. 3C]|uniref:acylphosphatase n=1 Tax=Verrucomicrobium sp. 3C TaxID=1134055 RepID=UPI00037C6BF8|nr:acylphosphatase [Verrucomicrobium sp. 3C]